MADKPFPTSEAELNLFLQNFVAKLGSYSVTLGLTAGEVTALENDAANFNYIITAATQVNDSKDAFFSFKSQLTDGDPSTTPIVPPVFPIIATPEAANPGIKKRTRALVQRIKTSPGYTEQIGEDLGLVDSGTGEIDLGPEGLTAALNVVAISDNRVSITFSRQGMDAMRVEMKRKNDVNW